MAAKEYLDCSSTNVEANSWFDLSKSDYAKVIFSDLYHSSDSSVGCRFQITDNVHEDPCDYVGLFKVGYENLSQCLVSKTLSDTDCEDDGKLLRCTFKSHELPKLENGFYQFLYVTRDNEVCGASLPFEIKQSITVTKDTQSYSSDEDVVADKTEDDFLVVRSTIAEQNRNLQDLINKMNAKSIDQEKFYSGCVTKLAKEKAQLEKELKKVREERDVLCEECKKLIQEKKIICQDNELLVENLEQQIIALASKMEVAYDKFKGLEKVKDALEEDKNKALQEKAEIEKSCEQLMKDLEVKMSSVNLLQKELNLKQEHDLKQTSEFENVSVLVSQLEDTKLMIAALEESKQLVRNEVTQLAVSNTELTECNTHLRESSAKLAECNTQLTAHNTELIASTVQLKENIKELRCENLALKLKLKDAENLNEKIKHRNERLNHQLTLLKQQILLQSALPISLKVQNSVAKPELGKKSLSPMLGATADKVLNIDSYHVERESLKSQCDKLQAELLEKEAIITKLKEDCLKKDAVVEYLSKEKDNVHKTSVVMEEALNDSVLRLKEAAEIYKKQYLEIEKLKKKLEKAKSKCKERYPSESSSVKDELASSVEIKDDIVAEDTEHPENQSSDSDTGEHVLGHLSEVKKNVKETVPVVLVEESLQSSFDEEFASGKKLRVVLNGNFKDMFGQNLDMSYLDIASTSNQTPKSRQSPELQSMIDQNLAKLSLSKSKEEEEEVMYSLPCPICDTEIGMYYTSSSEEMIKHLEVQHQQQLCPICDRLFDMTLPPTYFQFHVENHFLPENIK